MGEKMFRVRMLFLCVKKKKKKCILWLCCLYKSMSLMTKFRTNFLYILHSSSTHNHFFQLPSPIAILIYDMANAYQKNNARIL